MTQRWKRWRLEWWLLRQDIVDCFPAMLVLAAIFVGIYSLWRLVFD